MNMRFPYLARLPLWGIVLAVAPFLATASAFGASDQLAIVATVEADYSGAAHSVVSVDPVGGPRTASNNLLPTDTSDISVAAAGDFFYRLECFQRDNIAKFAIDAPTVPIWQYSTQDAGAVSSSNPRDLVFLDEQTAYVLRYGAATAWLVDLATTSENGFKLGEVDLSAYADADGLPEMTAGVVVGDRLFVLLQRLDSTANWAPGIAYLAVFDTATQEEIETNADAGDGLKGIPLPIRNPGAVLYQADSHALYVQGAGRYEAVWSGTPAEYSGGVVRIDPETYATALVLDDGDEADHPYGNIAGLAIVNAVKGYFIGYAGWGDNTLYSLDLTNGQVAAVDELAHKNIAGMESGAYVDANGMLWVCNATDARIEILDSVTDTIDESVDTGLNPLRVVFTGRAAAIAAGNGGGGGSSGGCFLSTMQGAAAGSWGFPLLWVCAVVPLVAAFFRGFRR